MTRSSKTCHSLVPMHEVRLLTLEYDRQAGNKTILTKLQLGFTSGFIYAQKVVHQVAYSYDPPLLTRPFLTMTMQRPVWVFQLPSLRDPYCIVICLHNLQLDLPMKADHLHKVRPLD